MYILKLALCFLSFTGLSQAGLGQIERIWLTHRTNEPSHLVINWQSNKPGNSEVHYRAGTDKELIIIKKEKTTLHHLEIPLTKMDVIYNYQVFTEDESSEVHSFKSYPSGTNELRTAVIGNWAGGGADLSKLMEDKPHILFTLGDNIPNLHGTCGAGTKDCIEPFLKLIDSNPELFRSIPLMPVLGNHDKEMRPRGQKYPPEAVYDIDATAYRMFFELPDDEWKWHFKIPDFNICFIALDLNHISDFGTTWQTCHPFSLDSEQLEWYKGIMKDNSIKYKITLQNEKNDAMRQQAGGEWQKIMQQGTAVITGFGHYSERAEVNGFPYFNSSLVHGDEYPDKFSKALYGVKGYILITATESSLKIDIKSLDGKVLDSTIR